MPLEPGYSVGNGPTSSRSHSGGHDSRTLPIPQLLRSLRSSPEVSVSVTSSSGQSYTSTELCTCTDFWTLEGNTQLSLALTSSGKQYGDGADPRCHRCNLVRPSRITSLSTSRRS